MQTLHQCDAAPQNCSVCSRDSVTLLQGRSDTAVSFSSHARTTKTDSAAVWPEGALPREQHGAMGLARQPGTLSSGFCLKCNSQLALISSDRLQS